MSKNASVYVFSADNGLVKVGISIRPEARLKDAAYSRGLSPLSVKMAFSSEPRGDARDVERIAHRLLSASQERGEWFSASERDAVAAVTKAISIADGHEEDISSPLKYVRRTIPANPKEGGQTVRCKLSAPDFAALARFAKDDGRTVSNAVECLVMAGLSSLGYQGRRAVSASRLRDTQRGEP